MSKPGHVEITFEYTRHVGPTIVHGGVTLQFESARPYGFESIASWPGENHEQTIRDTVERVLVELQGHLDTTRVILKRIEWHDMYSAQVGFARAAAAATRAAFEV
ncbi:hypothetical protein [Bradyrhizobium sp. USDA 4353]